MNRQLLLASVVAASGLAAFFSAVPDGIRRAEGCSGASSVACGAPGWSSAAWAVDPTGVPTNGAVLVELTAAYTCLPNSGAGGSSGGAGVTISVRGPDGALVPGTPGTVAGPTWKAQPSADPYTGTQKATWRPTSPFLPATTYALRVEGLVGATKSVELSFTTGAGTFATPKPVLGAPSLALDSTHVTGTSICCKDPPSSTTSCNSTSTCAGQFIQPRLMLSAKADVDEPVPAAKALLIAVLQVSKDDGPFVKGAIDVTGAANTVCARVEATNVITKETALSEPWCAPVTGIDLTPSPNCASMLGVLAKCGVDPEGNGGSSGYQLSPSKAGAIALYQSTCGAAGAGGDTGSTAGSGGSAAGSGGSAAGAAGDAGKGGGGTSGAAPATPAAEADDDGGCSVPTGPRPAGAGALGALVGLAALRRARLRRGPVRAREATRR